MTDIDEHDDDGYLDWQADGEAWDDDPLEGYRDNLKEEPDCYDCNDTGSHGYKPCPSCRPSWARRTWWRLTDPIRGRWRGWRMRRRAPRLDDAGPF